MNSTANQHISENPVVPPEFHDICPFDDSCFHDKLRSLVKEPGFEHAIRYIMPDVDYQAFVDELLSVVNQSDFQHRIMGNFLEMLVAKTTDGLSATGLENISPDKSFTFLSNHRDIVLDASFLNLCFIRAKVPLTQVAIGNNLLIYDWITDLVKLNRSFIVKRDVKKLQALDAARQLSAYIHYTITKRNESVWIAQRQGRAKDSNDLTQESLLKMLAIAGEGDALENILELNIVPVSISYEYDPNDYLKAKEYLLKRRDPEYKKSPHDDLLSMETGLLSPKGRVHFAIGKCINDSLSKTTATAKPVIVHEACAIIDRTIHQGYMIYPCNYIAYDKVNNSDEFAEKYTDADIARFEDYINSHLAKVDVPDITEEEREYMRHMMYSMYANPLKNKLAVSEN